MAGSRCVLRAKHGLLTEDTVEDTGGLARRSVVRMPRSRIILDGVFSEGNGSGCGRSRGKDAAAEVGADVVFDPLRDGFAIGGGRLQLTW
jgi:hypothetical protein